MAATPLSPEDTARTLATTRRLRLAGYVGILAPMVFVVTLVIANRLTSGGLHFFVNRDPWTRTFWSALFWTFAGGCAFLVLTVTRRCPRCGYGFFVSKSYRRTRADRAHTGGLNVFANRCVNCELPLG